MARQESHFITQAWRSVGTLGIAALLLIGCLGVAPSAKADIFTLNATVGDLVKLVPAPGPHTGLTLTGTLNIDTTLGSVTGVDLTVQGDPNIFTHVLNPSCPLGICIVYGARGFTGIHHNIPLPFEAATLDIGTLTGYAGGPLQTPLSVTDLANPFSAGPTFSGLKFYELSGSVVAPEPGLYGTLAIGLSGLLFVGYRRRRSA